MGGRTQFYLERVGRGSMLLAFFWSALGLLLFASLVFPPAKAIIDSTGLFSQEAPHWFCTVFSCGGQKMLPYPLEVMLVLIIAMCVVILAGLFIAFNIMLFLAFLALNLLFPSLKLQPPFELLTRLMNLMNPALEKASELASHLGGALLLAVPLIFALGLFISLTGASFSDSNHAGLFYVTHAALFFSLALGELGFRIRMG